MKKVLISPAHYLIDINSQSEYYLTSKIIFWLAQKDNSIQYDVLCWFCANNDLLPKNINIYSYFDSYDFSLNLKNRIFFYFWICFKSIILSAKNKYDVIWHLFPNGRYSFNLFLLFKLNKLFNIRKSIIWPLQVFRLDYNYHKVNNGKLEVKKYNFNILKILYNFLWFFSKYYFNWFDNIVYINNSSKNDYFHFLNYPQSKNNFNIIWNGIDSGRFFFSEKFLKWDKINFMYVWNFIANKNIDKILFILNELKYINDNFVLNLIWDWPELKNIENLILELNLKEYVIFHWVIPNNKMNNFYKDANFLFLLSNAEGFPHTLLEAWITWTLFIWSNIEAFKWMVNDLKNWLIFDFNKENLDYKSIAEKIHSIDNNLYKTIINNAKNDCREFYFSNIINKYYDIINNKN